MRDNRAGYRSLDQLAGRDDLAAKDVRHLCDEIERLRTIEREAKTVVSVLSRGGMPNIVRLVEALR